jgi:hypothetical protein
LYHLKTENEMIGRTNEEGGTRKNNIFTAAVFITVVMAIVLVAFSSTVSASFVNRTFTPTGGTLSYSDGFLGKDDIPDPDDEMIILVVYNWASSKKAGGEKIRFFNLTNATNVSVKVVGPYTKSGTLCSGYDEETDDVAAGEEWNAKGKKTSGYYMVYDVNTTGDNKKGGWLQVVKQKFSVALGEERDKVQEGKNFNLSLESSNKKEKVMKLTIEDNEEYSIMNVNRTDIYEVRVNYTKESGQPKFTSEPVDTAGKPVHGITNNTAGELVFNTSQLDMTEGKYKIILEDYATKAEDDVTITVEKRYLKVECDDVVKGKDIVIIIRSSFYKEEANVTVEGIQEKEGKRRVKLDEDGKKKVKIHTENEDYGTYKITVEVCDTIETKYVNVKRSGTSLEVPEDATVGDIVHIKGTAESGDFAVLLVDDVFKNKARITNEEFAWDWDTGGEPAEYREIEVFIVNESELSSTSVGETIGDAWQREHGVDASASIFLFLPTFSMAVPKNIAKGDDVVISGTVIGADHVYVTAINYKGEVVFPTTKAKWCSHRMELQAR